MEPWVGTVARRLGLRSAEQVQRAVADQGLQPHVSLGTLLRLDRDERKQVFEHLDANKLEFLKTTEADAFKRWAHAGGSSRLKAYHDACALLREHPSVRVWDALLMSDERYKLGSTPVMGRSSWACSICETELPLPHQLLPFIEECPACGLEPDEEDEGTLVLRLDSESAQRQLRQRALSTWAISRRGVDEALVQSLMESDLSEGLVLEANVPFDQVMELGSDPVALHCDGCSLRYNLGFALASVAVRDCACPVCTGTLLRSETPRPREPEPELSDRLREEALTLWARGQGVTDEQIAAAKTAEGSLSEALVMAGAIDFAAAMELDEEQARMACGDCYRVFPIGLGLTEAAQESRCPACYGRLAAPGELSLEDSQLLETGTGARDAAHAQLQKQALVSWAMAKGASPEALSHRLEDTASLPKLLGELPEVGFEDVLLVLKAEEALVGCLDCDARYTISEPLVSFCESVPCPSCKGTLREGDDLETDKATPRRLGQYRLGRLLGRGGMAEVFLAENAAGERVALKVLLRELSDPAFRVRFEREAQILEGIDHPNVVRTQGSGIDAKTSRHYIVLELVSGRTLTQILKGRDGKRLAMDEAAFVLTAIAKGLRAVHAEGVIHRDLKPSNVLVTPQGEVKLTDFGIALPTDTSARLTAKDEVLGTPHYLAPEFMEGETEWSASADLYALGVMAFRMLTGVLPFSGKDQNYVKLFWRKQSQDPERVGQFVETVPADVEDLVAGLLSRDAESRPSLAAVLDALDPYLPGAPPSLVPDLTLLHTISSGVAAVRAPKSELDTGTTFGDYLLEAELGRGGMGIVYRARHQVLKRQVALKVLLSGALASEDERRRFLREAESAAALNHPHIVRVLDVGQHDGTYFLSMEFVEGDALSSYHKPIDDNDALIDLLIEVCDAVHHAHSRGVVHRDLKPDNIIVDAELHPHVLDFGIAKRIDAENDTINSDLTTDGDVIGTLRYMPPEQAAGEVHLVDVRSDVYALGSILYELLAKRTPFTGSVREILHQIHFAEPRPPSLERDLPWELDAICLKALEKEQDDRYQSVLELKQDLQRYRQGVPIRARQATGLYRLKKWAIRNKRQALAIVSAATVLLTISGAWGFQAIAREQQRKNRIVQATVEGWDHAAQRRFVEASKSFERALQIVEPDDVLQLPQASAKTLPPGVLESLDEQERKTPRIHGDRLSAWQEYVEQRRHHEQANAVMLEAKTAFSEGRLDEAAAALQKVLLLAPDDPEALSLGQDVATRLLKHAQAELESAKAEEVQDYGARAGHLRLALGGFEAARELTPDHPDVMGGLVAVREQEAILERDRSSGQRYDEAQARLAKAQEALEDAKELAKEDPAKAEQRLRRARLDLAAALERWPGLEEAKVVSTRVALTMANLWLQRDKIELAEQELDLARVYGLLEPEIEALAEVLRSQDRDAQAFRAHAQRGDAFYARGAFSQAQAAYELALSLREDSTVVEKRSLCAALVEAALARESGDAESERKALLTARGFHQNPDTLDARIARLDDALYQGALIVAESAFSSASRSGAGWEEVVTAYDRALGYDLEGEAALSGRADAYAELRRPADMLLVSVPARLLVKGAAANRLRQGEKVRFYVERDEVTAAEYVKFVAAGGYSREDLWDAEGWQARAAFVDTTGRPGPQGWVEGTPPAGTAAMPVSGISWYEARAFARWRRRRLLSEQEWVLAACFDLSVGAYQRCPWPDGSRADLGKRRTAAVPGALQADVSPWQVRDMGLNVSEWVVDRSHGADVPSVRGLSFRSFPHDLERGVRDWRKRPKPLFRDAALGLRCARTVPAPPPLRPKGSR